MSDEEELLIEDIERPSAWKSFVAGTIGGFAGVITGHPFDTVKVRLQSQAGPNPKYNGTVNCFLTIIREEKVTGLYKGMASPLVGVGLVNALLFGVYGLFLNSMMTKDQSSPTLTQIFLAGSGSGLVNSIISCPMELAKIKLQNQIESTSGSRQHSYSGPVDCLKKLYIAKGIRGCYTGMVATILRETPSYGAYFASYEVVCRLLTPDGASVQELSGTRLMVAGGLSGIAGWLSTYPFDVAKTKIQAQDESISRSERYKGTYDCLRRSYRAEGLQVLFRGLNATLIRAFPTNAATFLAYTIVMRTIT